MNHKVFVDVNAMEGSAQWACACAFPYSDGSEVSSRVQMLPVAV